MSFDDLTLHFPDLWAHDWSELIASGGESERLVYESQRKLANVLRGLAKTPVNPEKLAWLAIWSRSYSLLSAALGVWTHNSFAEMWVLQRVRFELTAHCQLLADALRADADGKTVRDALRGYLAWTLWEELTVLREVLKPENLNAIFDPNPRREMLSELGPAVATWQAVTGQEIELTSDQEVAFDRGRAESRFRQRETELAHLLEDVRLRSWAIKLESGKIASFPELLGRARHMKAVLDARDLGFAYLEYKRGSAAIHCTSLDAALVLRPPLVAPRFFDVLDSGLDELRDIAIATNLSLLVLTLALRHLDMAGA